MDDLMTLDQMRTVLGADRVNLQAAVKRLTAAEATYQSATRRVAYSSDEGHAIALRDHLPALMEEERAAERVAIAAAANARAVRAQAQAATRITVSPGDQAAAAVREPIIRRIAETSDLPDVLQEFRAAIVADDTPDAYLFATFLPVRLKAVPAAFEANRPEIGEARRQLRDLVARTRERLRDTRGDDLAATLVENEALVGAARRAAAGRRVQIDTQRRVDEHEIVRWPRAS